MPETIQTYSPANILQPAQYPDDARRSAGKFGASLTLAKGTVLAKKTSDGLLYAYANTASGAAANEVQTLAIAGTLSAGGFRLRFVDKDGKGQVTGLIAYNADTAAIQAAIDVVIPQVESASVVIAGGTAITATTLTFSGVGYAALPQTLVEVMPDGLTGYTNSSVTRTTAGHAASLTFPTDGTQTPVGILECAIKTDSASKVFFSTTSAVASADNPPCQEASFFVSGTFAAADLTGWDANAATILQARTLANGYIRIP